MSSTTTKLVPQKHEHLYFDDGNSIFLVGNTLFKLHRSFLCQDPESLFKSLFSLPTPSTPKTNLEDPGLDDSAAYIPLHDIDEKVFTVLVRMLYARAVRAPTDTASSLPIADWILFFELVDRFCMESLIQYAVQIITSIPITSLDGDLGSKFLHLANRFTMSFTIEYRESLFRHILARGESLSEIEMALLGHQLSARISRLREKLREQVVHTQPSPCSYGCGLATGNYYCGNCGNYSPVQAPVSNLKYDSLYESAKQHSLLA